jgi:hypothetical protein
MQKKYAASQQSLRTASNNNISNSKSSLAPSDSNQYESLNFEMPPSRRASPMVSTVGKASSASGSRTSVTDSRRKNLRPNVTSQPSVTPAEPPTTSNEKILQSVRRSRKFYLNIQLSVIVINFALTLVIFTLSLWINVDNRFRFLNMITNRIIYSSLYRIFGLFPAIILFLSCVEIVLNMAQFIEYLFVRDYLNSLKSLETSRDGRVRVRRKRLVYEQRRRVLIHLNTYTYMLHFIYIFILLGFKISVAVFFLVKFRHILNYQFPQTLVKVIREYERVRIEEYTKQWIVKEIFDWSGRGLAAANRTPTLEETLIDMMNVQFKCCNYQNAYQYGDLKPASCDMKQGCLRPIQDFLWHYLYISIIILLFVSLLKLFIQIVFLFNFYLLLVKKIMSRLDALIVREDEDEDDDDDGENLTADEARRKLMEIRRQKEEQLAREEREEEERRLKEENAMRKLSEFEKLQDEYELLLFKQKRYDELRYEQMQRRLQSQHLSAKKANTSTEEL